MGHNNLECIKLMIEVMTSADKQPYPSVACTFIYNVS